MPDCGNDCGILTVNYRTEMGLGQYFAGIEKCSGNVGLKDGANRWQRERKSY